MERERDTPCWDLDTDTLVVEGVEGVGGEISGGREIKEEQARGLRWNQSDSLYTACVSLCVHLGAVFCISIRSISDSWFIPLWTVAMSGHNVETG